MSTENNKALVRRFFDEFNKKNVGVADQICANNYVLDFPGGPGTAHGPAELKQKMTDFIASFPDLQYAIDDLLAEGDRAVARWTMRATHKGNLGPFPASGKAVTLTGISLLRLADGKIVEDKVRADMVGLLQQIGVIPAPEPVGL